MMNYTHKRWSRAAKDRRGGSLVMMSMSATALATLAMSMAVVSKARSEEQSSAKQELAALYSAEAALAEAVFTMETGGSGAVQWKNYGGANYSVQSAPVNATVTSLTAAASNGSARARVELQVRQTTGSMWQFGAFGDLDLTMDSNAHVDSYDSGAGAYSSQEVNGNGNATYANSNGHVGSNQDVQLDSNASVHGNSASGPSGSTTTIGNSFVTGSTTPAAAVVALPPIVVPVIASSGTMVVSGSQTLAPGNYNFDLLRIDSSDDLTVIGPATIVATDMVMRSNSELIVDATNGPVEFFVLDDFVLDSNTLLNSTTPNAVRCEHQLVERQHHRSERQHRRRLRRLQLERRAVRDNLCAQCGDRHQQ